MSIKIIHIHRTELYNKVWEKPVIQVAEEYGISGNALKKICNKLNVPVPYNGYWRRLETKHDVFQPPLPHLKPGEKEIYELKIEKKDENVLSDKYRTLIEQEESPDNKIIVKNRYVRDHPLVSKARQLLLSGRKDSDGMLRIIMKDALNIAVTQANLSRSLRIMNALIYELEKRNFVVKTRMSHHRLPEIILIFDGREIEIDMREVMKITKVKKEYGTSIHKMTEYERKLIPTDVLRLEIKNFWNNGTLRIVKDNKKQNLEDQLNLFIICVYRVINYDINRHAKWEAERKIREEEERIIKLKLEEEKREQEKTERLFELVEESRKYDVARQFVDLVESSLLANNELSADKKDWIVWARSKIEQRNPIKNIFEP